MNARIAAFPGALRSKKLVAVSQAATKASVADKETKKRRYSVHERGKGRVGTVYPQGVRKGPRTVDVRNHKPKVGVTYGLQFVAAR